METHATPKACIIGAGGSAFTSAKRLKDHGIAFERFKMSDKEAALSLCP